MAAPISVAEIKKLNKEKLLEYAIGLTQGFVALHQRCEDFSSRLAQLESAAESNADTSSPNPQLQQRVEALERENLNNSQYLRRRQIEIWNLPTASTDASDLKKEVAAILSLTDVPVTPGDLDVCHKLKKDGRVIMEFRHRDLRDRLIRARKNLKHKKSELARKNCPKMSVVESMAPEFKRLDFVCRQLKTRDKVDKTYFFNRKLYVCDSDGTKVTIGHMSDLVNKFGKDIIDDILQ